MGNSLEQWRASIGGWTRGQVLSTSSKWRDTSSSPWFQLIVVMVLLVIGGIEMNPGPIHSEMSKYKKTTGHADMTGELYELKMSALLFLRALQKGQPFLLASNMDVAGCFDDVVLMLGDMTVFLQLKHKEKSNTILRLSHLTRDKQFNLPKYLKSYLDIKQHWQDNPDLQHCGRFEDAKFVIFTNARVDENLVNAADSAELLNIVSTGGTCVCLTELFDSLPKYKAVLSAAISTEYVTATPEMWEVVHKLYHNQAQALPSKKQLEQMLEQLESLGDVAHYQQFISQLYLCAGQMAEKDVDHLIRHEILTCCGTDTVLQDFMDGVHDWWRNSNCHLTVKAKFFQDILQTLAANVTKHISGLKVNFIENECNLIKQNVISSNRKMYIKTDCTKLSCIKVLQSFKNSILVDVDTLQAHLSEVLAICRLGVCDVLVVEGETTDATILHELASMPDSKCVVVISVNGQPQLYQQFKFASCVDTFWLNQLDLDSQRGVLEHEVMFQGFPVKLSSLADVSFLQSAVTADTVVQLHNTLHIGHKLHDLDSCYIPRTFLRREYVGEHIFREEQINLALTGISKDRLAQMLQKDEIFHKFHPGHDIDTACRYFLIEGEAEFTALCSVKDSVHWIEASGEGFLWRKSKGDMSLLIEYLEEKYVSYAGAEEVVALPQQVVLVVGEPGMGKSTEMCNTVHEIKQKDKSAWVIMVDLNKHTTLLSQNQIDAMEFLETVATLNTEFQKQLFEHQLESSGNVVILLDGFDEISPNFSKQVFDLLTKFSDCKIRKIFVTSRPVMIKELQEKLSILAFSFQAFTPDDQKDFLIRHWNQTVSESLKLSNFISLLLELMETSLNDKSKEFTGIPLQSMMLAEVFQDEALYYCQTGEVRLPQSLNMLQLYNKFVEKKWQVYCRKLYGDVSNAMQQISIENEKRKYQDSIMCCALVSYFEDYDIRRLHKSEKVLKQNQKFIEMFKKGEDKLGIVSDIDNNKTVFVHRTFAEYFVAMWFSKHLDSQVDNLSNFYLDDIFYVVRKFLDRMLTREMKLHTAVLNEDVLELQNLLSKQCVDINKKDGGGRTALHLAVMNYCNKNNKIDNSIIETLLEHGADVNCKDKVLHWRPLQLAQEIRAWYVVDKLLEKQVNSKDSVQIKKYIKKQLLIQNPVQVVRRRDLRQFTNPVMNTYVSSSPGQVMYTALCEGYVNLVELILNCGVSVRHYIDVNNNKMSMLHVAAEHGQLRLVQWLIEQGADIDDKTCWFNRTPLMQAAESGYVQVVELLINHGASVNARDKDGNTALLLAAHEGNLKVLELLLQKGADVGISGGWCNRTPLMQAAEYGHVQIVELLINHGVSVNARDKFGDTALLLAARLGNFKINELLLQKGADVELCGGKSNRTPLMQAAECGHVQIVELLINYGASVNTSNKYGNTALLLAASKGNLKIVKLLLQRAADVEICGDWYNRTPLTRAAECGHVQIVELFINHGLSESARDKYTALLLAASKGNLKIVELLLQKGADVQICSDWCNRTPLMEAAVGGNLQIVELFINHGLSVNARDEYGNTALLLAASKGNLRIVEKLLQKGADVGISNRNDTTPLMQAAKSGNLQIVELFINHGLPVNARDKYGNTALLLAASKGNHRIVEKLLQKRADVGISNKNDTTPLMEAAKGGNLQIVKLFINHGLSVNARDKYGNTALLLAASKKNLKIVELLLQKGADVEISGGWYNRTPLMEAAKGGNLQIVEFFINHGLSVNARDKNGNTALLLAASKGNFIIVEKLLQNGADVGISDEDYTTPLMQAAKGGNLQIVELFINHGLPVNARDEYGNTALLFAASKGNFIIVEKLLQNGADVGISDEDYTTPLMQAAKGGNLQIVELFINHGASVNARDKYGNTALLFAAREGNVKIVELLLQKGADVGISDEDDTTPLMEAAKGGNLQIIELFINHEASVNARDKYGNTALLLAASKGNFKIVEKLLQKGADVGISNKNGTTPLMEAAKGGNLQIIELFINHGASVNARDKYGNTALLLAASKGNLKIVELLQKGADVGISNKNDTTPLMEAAKGGNLQIVKLFINHGISVNARDKYGKTALLLAAREGNVKTVELLLQKGADVGISDEDDTTPLMEAAKGGNLQIVELFINHGLSVNARDKYGNTALLFAAHEGNVKVVELLLQKGSDVEISDSWYNRTPLMQAAHGGHVQIVELLINHGASVNARDGNGDTALSLALTNNHNNIVELLLQHGACK